MHLLGCSDQQVENQRMLILHTHHLNHLIISYTFINIFTYFKGEMEKSVILFKKIQVEVKYLFINKIMYEKFNMTESINPSDFTSLNRLAPSQIYHVQTKSLLANKVAEELFFKSLSISHIGHISGKQQDLSNIKYEQIQQSESYNLKKNKKRVDFSQYRSKNLQSIKESTLEDQDTKYMFIQSFMKGNQQILKQTGCTDCNNCQDIDKCRLDLFNQSTLQVYLPNKKGLFEVFLLSFNFDTIAADVEFDNIPENRQLQLTAGIYRIIFHHQKRYYVQWWFEKLNAMIFQSKGKQIHFDKLLKKNDFYKQRFETQQYFLKNCETGDILLFQDDHFFAKAQRFFTGSDFNHVGMMIKDLNHGLLIFQANSKGVCLTPWSYVIKYGWYKTIPKITWRRLRNIQKTGDFNEKIERFVLLHIQKHYHISLGKLMGNESIIRPENQQEIPEQSGFFCSELVATIYKQLGLLTRDMTKANYQPACKFYPKDFSEKGGRKLDRGNLSSQYTIFFDDALLKQTYEGIITDS